MIALSVDTDTASMASTIDTDIDLAVPMEQAVSDGTDGLVGDTLRWKGTRYALARELGSGKFATVYELRAAAGAPSELVAKVTQLADLSPWARAQLKQEEEIWRAAAGLGADGSGSGVGGRGGQPRSPHAHRSLAARSPRAGRRSAIRTSCAASGT